MWGNYICNECVYQDDMYRRARCTMEGHLWSQQLDSTARKCRRSVLRALGASKQSQGLSPGLVWHARQSVEDESAPLASPVRTMEHPRGTYDKSDLDIAVLEKFNTLAKMDLSIREKT